MTCDGRRATLVQERQSNGSSSSGHIGTLYLVATPIGNLRDMSLRGIDTLKGVDLIASEDTRKTGLLLQHYGIATRQMSFHEHNELTAGGRIMVELRSGKSVALVTSAGTPGVSDPGFTLVREAIQGGIPVTMVPGPSALIMALVLSGLAVHSFTFRGFPPRKGGPRRRFFEVDRDAAHTLVYYESPHRLVATLRDALVVFGDRPCALANDLTKRFEAVQRGTLAQIVDLAAGSEPRGEYTVVIAGAGQAT